MRRPTKNELLAQMKNAKQLQRYARSMPFTTLCTVCNYSLWHDFQFSIEELEKYNQEFADIYATADREMIKNSAAYLHDRYETDITVVLYNDRDWARYKSSKSLMEQKKQQMIAANEMFLTQQKYLVVHLLTLEKMGYGKDFLCKNKSVTTHYLSDAEVKEPDLMRIEMEEEIGLVIELPS